MLLILKCMFICVLLYGNFVNFRDTLYILSVLLFISFVIKCQYSSGLDATAPLLLHIVSTRQRPQKKNILSRIWKRCPPTLFFQRVRIGSVNYSSTDRLWMWFPAENIYSTSYAAVRICRYFIRNNRNWRDAVSDNARSQARFSSGNVFFFVLYYLCVYTSFQSIASVLFYRCFPETPAVAKLKKMTF